MATAGEYVPRPIPEVSRREEFYRWITTVDDKKIGILYLVTTLGFFCSAGWGPCSCGSSSRSRVPR